MNAKLQSAGLGLLVALTATATSLTAQGNDELRAALAKLEKLNSDYSLSLTVNGQTLAQSDVDRQTIYMVGQRVMQQKLIELIVEDQMAQQIQAGVDKKVFAVIEGEVQKQIEKTIAEFKKKNPGMDFWAELAKTNTSREEYLVIQRATLLFDKVFFRGIPAKWPEITKEAIIASGGPQGQQFLDKFVESVKEGQEVPPLWLHICRQWVVGKMQEWSDVRYASDGLPRDVVLSVNGRKWKTADAAKALALRIKPEDRTRALVDIALQTSLRQELEKKGAWLDDAGYRKEFAEYRKPYDETPFTVKVLALSFKGYPSFEVYKARWRLERSFEKMIAADINDDNLKKHLERAKNFLGDGRASLKIIRIPAFDDAKGTWRPNGFELAHAQAANVMGKIERKELTFDEALEKFAKWPSQYKDQGRLTSKSLNELRTELRENEYTDFIHGFSVGNILFYDLKKGQVAGPLRGQDGYYIALKTDMTPAPQTMSLEDKNQRDLVKQDYVSHRFLAWANQVAGRTKVQ